MAGSCTSPEGLGKTCIATAGHARRLRLLRCPIPGHPWASARGRPGLRLPTKTHVAHPPVVVGGRVVPGNETPAHRDEVVKRPRADGVGKHDVIPMGSRNWTSSAWLRLVLRPSVQDRGSPFVASFALAGGYRSRGGLVRCWRMGSVAPRSSSTSSTTRPQLVAKRVRFNWCAHMCAHGDKSSRPNPSTTRVCGQSLASASENKGEVQARSIAVDTAWRSGAKHHSRRVKRR